MNPWFSASPPPQRLGSTRQYSGLGGRVFGKSWWFFLTSFIESHSKIPFTPKPLIAGVRLTLRAEDK